MLKNLFTAGRYFRTADYYINNYNFRFVYLDHLEYLNSIHCFNIDNEYIKIPETGFNIYWLQSFVNHSSEPNSITHNIYGTYNDIISIQNIKPEEEITINFTNEYPEFYTKGKKWAKK